MKKLILILLPFFLTGCEGIGPKKTKYITELTPKLILESDEPIIVSGELKVNAFTNDLTKLKSYNLTKNKIIAPPAFAKGVVYIIDNHGRVIAFSKKEKKILWTQDVSHRTFDHNHLGGGIVYNDEKLYITNGSRFLVVLDSKTGYEIVRKEFPDIIRTKPVMPAGLVLLQTVSNQVFAYDVHRSVSAWQHDGLFETLSSSLHTRPVLYDSNVLVGYSSGQIFSLNVKDGKEVWALNLSQTGDVTLPSFEAVTLSCQPIVDGNHIYLSSSTGKILKLLLKSGEIIWEAKANDIQSMSLNGNSLFVTNNAQQVGAISTLTGKVKWVADLNTGKEKQKKRKGVQLLEPVISKINSGFVLSIISSEGEIYNFVSDDNRTLPPVATRIKGLKNTQFIGATCCGDTYLVNEKQILFID